MPDDTPEFYVRNASNEISHSVNQEGAWYLPDEAFSEPNSDKMDKEGLSWLLL